FQSVSVFLFLSGLTLQDNVAQFPSIISESQGGETTLKCTYEYTGSSATVYLQWYKQSLPGVPQYIIQRYSSGQDKEFKERFSSELSSSNNKFSLLISPTILADSGVYYCAASYTLTDLFS
uniref:Ig-like domain-containing protein n=1 Tax=Erpetoichthys calabaricus TaxID=27687 RepID=A0A8C4SBY6_ERPCA